MRRTVFPAMKHFYSMMDQTCSFVGLLITLSLLVSAGGSSPPPAYSVTRAKYSVDFAGAAYCAGTLGRGVEDWSCSSCKNHPNVENRTVISKGSVLFDFNAFVAYDKDENTVVVSIAGTDPLKIRDYIDDFDASMIPYAQCDGCKVHQGFWSSYELGAEETKSAVDYLLNAYQGAKLTVTGHSLGGIVAVLAALDLQQAGHVVDSVITFGEPRGGNDAFATFAGESLPATNTFRLTHYTDPIPQLAPRALGFRHHTNEIYYSERDSDGAYLVCSSVDGEDETCQNSLAVCVNLDMHLHYVGFDFVGNYLKCKL